MKNQRWVEGRDSYRPSGEPIRTSEYEVAELPGDACAKDFVLRHHYSGSYPASRFRYGLFRRGALAGVAVYSTPCRPEVLSSVFPGDPLSSVELGRFVLLDEVPGNGETWFLARTFELLRKRGLGGVLSFSDPVARTTPDGRLVFPGHIGTIYQAHNAAYLGRGKPRTLRILPDGTVFSARAMSKIRSMERGWRHASEVLVRHGASPLDVEDPAGWLRHWTARLTRPLRHGGNHKYAWALDRGMRRSLPPGLPYPKKTAAA